MAITIEIKFSGGSWTDISGYVFLDSLKIERVMHNKLVSVVNKASFTLKNATYINSINAANSDVLVRIKDGSNYLFSGVLSQQANTSVKSFVEGQELTALDYLYFLDKKLTSGIIGTNYYIKKDTDTSNSIFHILLVASGLTSYVNGNILTQIAVFKAIKGESIIEILDKLLFEYGYCLYADESGAIGVKQLCKDSWASAGTIDNSAMYGQLEIIKEDTEAEAAQVEWSELVSKTGITLAEDTTGGTSAYRCYIEVAAGEEYPTDSDTQDTFIEYKSTLGEVYAATSANLNITKSANLTTQTFTNLYTKAQICIKNSSGSTGTITKLQVTGNAYIKKNTNFSSRYIVPSTNKIYDYKAEYVFDKTNAQTLADWLAQYFYYSRLRYKFISKTDYTLGECYTLQESTLSINTKVLIRKKEYNFRTGFYTYEAEGITEYTAGTVSTESNIVIPATEILQADTNTAVQEALTQLSQDAGTTYGYFTTTPTAPAWGSCTVQNWLINLKWDKQWNLSNLDYYELQVSQDQSNWYDFDGNAGQYTIAYQETAAFKGGFTNSDPPLGIGYYFRVRRRTKDGTTSSWSSNLLATTIPIGKDGEVSNGLIWLDSNNFWDFINSKFKIGTSNKYIYFDGDNIYFKSVDIELTTADLITYNSGKTKRLIHTGLSLLAQGGENYTDILGGIKHDEANNKTTCITDELVSYNKDFISKIPNAGYSLSNIENMFLANNIYAGSLNAINYEINKVNNSKFFDIASDSSSFARFLDIGDKKYIFYLSGGNPANNISYRYINDNGICDKTILLSDQNAIYFFFTVCRMTTEKIFLAYVNYSDKKIYYIILDNNLNIIQDKKLMNINFGGDVYNIQACEYSYDKIYIVVAGYTSDKTFELYYNINLDTFTSPVEILNFMIPSYDIFKNDYNNTLVVFYGKSSGVYYIKKTIPSGSFSSPTAITTSATVTNCNTIKVGNKYIGFYIKSNYINYFVVSKDYDIISFDKATSISLVFAVYGFLYHNNIYIMQSSYFTIYIFYTNMNTIGAGIVQTGSNSNGSWVKFSNGFTIITINRIEVVTIPNAYGSLYVNAITFTLPITLTSTLSATVGKAQYSTGASWGYILSVTNSTVIVRIIDAFSRTSAESTNFIITVFGYS